MTHVGFNLLEENIEFRTHDLIISNLEKNEWGNFSTIKHWGWGNLQNISPSSFSNPRDAGVYISYCDRKRELVDQEIGNYFNFFSSVWIQFKFQRTIK